MSDNILENRIIREIEEITGQINDLVKQKDTLEVILRRVRLENSGLQDVTRKDSIKRVVTENRVIEMLRAGRHVAGTELYRDAKYYDAKLNHSSFRTLLHRMKKKEMIESAGRGYWKIIAPENN